MYVANSAKNVLDDRLRELRDPYSVKCCNKERLQAAIDRVDVLLVDVSDQPSEMNRIMAEVLESTSDLLKCIVMHATMQKQQQEEENMPLQSSVTKNGVSFLKVVIRMSLTQKNLRILDRTQCNEDESKMQRLEKFVQDQLPFVQKQAHYEDANKGAPHERQKQQQQQPQGVDHNKQLQQQHNHLPLYESSPPPVLTKHHLSSLSSHKGQRRMEKNKEKCVKSKAPLPPALLLSTVQQQRKQKKKQRQQQQQQQQRKKHEPVARTAQPASFHLLEKFTSPNIQITRISMRRGNNCNNRRAGMFNNGKSSSKARKTLGAADLVFSETRFLRSASNTAQSSVVVGSSPSPPHFHHHQQQQEHQGQGQYQCHRPMPIILPPLIAPQQPQQKHTNNSSVTNRMMLPPIVQQPSLPPPLYPFASGTTTSAAAAVAPQQSKHQQEKSDTLSKSFADHDKTWEEGVERYMVEESCKHYDPPCYARGKTPVDLLLLAQQEPVTAISASDAAGCMVMQHDDISNNNNDGTTYSNRYDDEGRGYCYYDSHVDEVRDTAGVDGVYYEVPQEPPVLRVPQPRHALASLLDHLPAAPATTITAAAPNDPFYDDHPQWQLQPFSSASRNEQQQQQYTVEKKYQQQDTAVPLSNRYHQRRGYPYQDEEGIDKKYYYSSSSAGTTNDEQQQTSPTLHGYNYSASIISTTTSTTTGDTEGGIKATNNNNNTTDASSDMDDVMLLSTWNTSAALTTATTTDIMQPPDLTSFWQQRRAF
ncbi:hypothetical protein BDB00DRAFT_903435 [Zychaea mexicana]|uniref:uncharacterized protein n=1 Tax=Zychaea mexicana TaxID=64656 RepID=UPI0022FE9285|nr:uncharacterized protein BDB00DRAFT_903435 [Zychaea mexicana]KAI9494393.1 hypothetical protein BDB00DRAFT_903435 [Zychaea mexicana]